MRESKKKTEEARPVEDEEEETQLLTEAQQSLVIANDTWVVVDAGTAAEWARLLLLSCPTEARGLFKAPTVH